MSQHVRVFVTGATAATCCGVGCEALWKRVDRDSRSVWGNLNGERPFSPDTPPPAKRRGVHSEHRLSAYLLAAIEQDLGKFLNALPDSEREMTGVALGTEYGHVGAYLSYFKTGTTKGYQLVNPRHFPYTLPNCTAMSIADAYTLWGSSTTLASGITAGLEAITYAADAIRNGDEEIMLAGGADELNESSRSAARRHGFVPAEGAAVLLLQSEESMKATGRQPLAEVRGAANCHGICWENPDSVSQAEETIRAAISASDLELDSVSVLLPSFSGVPMSDRLEDEILRRLFGKRRQSIMIVPVKNIVGECFAASGPLQAASAIPYLGIASQSDRVHAARSQRDQVTTHNTALMYTAGYDGSLAAIVLESPRDE